MEVPASTLASILHALAFTLPGPVPDLVQDTEHALIALELVADPDDPIGDGMALVLISTAGG
ncbi:hypothetical protein [Nannocystis punicea]|uniref:Uncharacterized protein n=1 Tax=Nannocystis punicea TaxID=2995304 RepID=A0ABY7HAR2_9BACT|nr:hypothetical protein [Nannocystis poenicansa]WAS96323.1 hypothetical protein O0S08_09195 [Nannocystis poenicansa]